MEPWINQFVAEEQKVVLRALAKAAAESGCLFLEVGSWCGDSALILGKAAQDAGGKLLCMDWWKGSDDSYLSWIAKNYDVYAIFWSRIKKAGLEDIVIPIRSNSEIAALFLKERTFDLVYLDSDHRYEPTSKDLVRFAPLVKPGGFFCGHDCEGKVSDFNSAFLQSGKDKDALENVHCGTVLAVGGFFQDYSINHSIWSVRSTAKDKGWEPTHLNFLGIDDRRQAVVPPIGQIGDNKVYRYGKTVFLVPGYLADADIRDESVRSDPGVISAENAALLSEKIHRTFCFLPVFIGEYKEFNLIQMGEEVIGVAQMLGQVDLSGARDVRMETWADQGFVFSGKTFEEVAQKISLAYPRLDFPAKLVEAYQGYNIVVWKEKFFAIAQALGQLDLRKVNLSLHEKNGDCIRADSIEILKALIDYKLGKRTLDD